MQLVLLRVGHCKAAPASQGSPNLHAPRLHPPCLQAVCPAAGQAAGGMFSLGSVGKCLSRAVAEERPLTPGCRQLVLVAAPRDARSIVADSTASADAVALRVAEVGCGGGEGELCCLGVLLSCFALVRIPTLQTAAPLPCLPPSPRLPTLPPCRRL